jgi:hypothetical protein
VTGLPKLEYNYWLRLLRACQPTSSQRGASTGSLPDDGPYGLGKRVSQLQEDTPVQPQSLAFKSEFTREYLATSRAAAGPHILKIGFNDYYSEVTVVETHALFHLFLMGTTKGVIKAVFMGKSEEQNRVDSEVIREERIKREKEVADLNAAANGSDAIINEEFFFNLSILEFVGHSSVITAISLKCDGTKFVSGAVDGEVRLWDVALRSCLAVYKDHFEAVFALKMSPRDDLFASAGSERLIYLRKESSDIRQKSFIGHVNDVKKVEFTSNMKYLLSSALDCTLRVWCLTTSECIRVVRTVSPMSTFQLTLNGDMVLAGFDSGQVCFIDLTKHHNHVIFRSNTSDGKIQGRVRAITVSPDEKTVSIMRKGQLSVLKMDEVYRLRDTVRQLELKEDAEAIKAIWQKEFKALCTHQFECERLDFVGGHHIFNHTLVTFLRNKAQ